MVAQLHRLTTLVRVIDFRFRSNRSIVAVVGLAAVIGVVAAPDGMVTGRQSAIVLAGTGFVAWALTRELDPDEPAAGLVAALVAVGLSLVIGAGDLVVLVGVLLTARLLLRSVGPPPTILDMAGLGVLGVYLGVRPGGWPVALMMAFAVARDRTLPGAVGPLGRLVALVIAAGATGFAITAGIGFWVRPSGLQWSVAIVGVVAGMLIRPIQPSSPTDAGGMVLLGSRLASARRITIGAAALAVVLSGSVGLVAVWPVYAVFVSIFLVQRRILPVGAGPEITEAGQMPSGATGEI